MMRIRFHFFLLLVGVLLSGSLFAAMPDQLNIANQALSSGHPREALAAYQSILSLADFSHFSTPEVWYNRGLAEEKNGDLVAASLSYRRALLLDPTLLSARKHLNSVLSTLGISEGATWKDHLFMLLHPDFLILGGAIIGWTGVMALVFLLISGRKQVHKRPVLIVLALTALVLGHGLSLMGSWTDPRREAVNQAIISGKGEQILRDTPADSAQAAGTLAPGSLVTILSRNGAWWKIASGSKTGWISSTVITPLLPAVAGS